VVNPVVSVRVCYTLVGRCRRRLDHGMVGYCVGVLLFTSFGCEKRLRGRAQCMVPGVSAAVAIAAWLGHALAVGVRTLSGGLDV